MTWRKRLQKLVLICVLAPAGSVLANNARQPPLEAAGEPNAASNDVTTPNPSLLDSSDPFEKETPVQLPDVRRVAWEDKETKTVEAKRGLSDMDRASVAFAVAFILGAGLAFRRMAPRIGEFLNAQHNPWVSMGTVATELSAKLIAEQEAFAKFTEAFKSGPVGRSVTPAPSVAASEAAPAVKPTQVVNAAEDALAEFLRTAPNDLASVRSLFAEVARAADDVAKKQVLRELCGRVTIFKDKSAIPEMLPVWQLATAVEGLLTQVTERKTEITASTLRTAASAVDLLEELCVRGLDRELAVDPPIRLLAVDDDLISRQAISMALKKSLENPDLANDGEAGLALAEKNAYDAIFLDVEMPGMDGFELCSRIQKTALNGNTPVVFVTSHTDFESRAKCSMTGARDLIGKPFMPFELTVKALALALRTRLETAPVASAEKKEVVPKGVQPVLTAPQPSPQVQKAPTSAAPKLSSPGKPAPVAAAWSPAKAPNLNDHARAMFAHVPNHLGEFRLRLRDLVTTPDPAATQDLLGDLYVSMRGLDAEAERAELHTVHKLIVALEGIVKKLLEKPTLCSPSTLSAAAEALELLGQLCRDQINPSLAEPPVRLLVVDDDPIARRAISGALQLTFGRPESADSGEAAVAVAQEQPFDLVFMDVMMPGMDGFAACAKIHETQSNETTPIVFVTGQADANSLAQSKEAGGCGFIPKPVIASEILLTALTFVIRARITVPTRWSETLAAAAAKVLTTVSS
jgi:CheY-like chemotaxis protein